MKYVRIFIVVCAIQKVYECRVSKGSTFMEIISVLKEMIREDLSKYYQMDIDFEIFDQFSNARCNKEVSLESLDVQDGMWFQLY